MKIRKINLTALLLVALSSIISGQVSKIEYIAHASFVVESAKGTRVLIDPYHSYSQLGYTFPTGVKADFVLLTHPHFDHDGSKYFSENTPVYRKSGTYTFKDIKFHGIASKHGGWREMDKRGLPSNNVIWVIEIGDVKIAHLGDNADLSAKEVSQLSDVNYVIGHPEDKTLKLFSNNTTYIPNHYLLPEISKHKNWMEPVDGWLAGKDGVTRLGGNTFVMPKKGSRSKILVFKPSNKVKEWSKDYYDALATISAAFKQFSKSKNSDEVLSVMDKVISLTPFTMEGYVYKANMLLRLKKNREVVGVLEKAMAKVSDIDWGTEIRVRKMLAEAYSNTGQKALAYNQYVWLAKQRGIADKNTIKVATEFIAEYGKD